MAKEYPTIPENLAKFAMEQKVFFIATCGADGEANLSPKGVVLLKVINESSAVYADYHGSGNRTAAHLKAGSKATIMFTSFGEEPLILRLFCTGRVVEKGSAEYAALCQRHYGDFDQGKFRQLFHFDVYRVQRSCGYGTPLMEYRGDRSGKPWFAALWGK